MKPEEAARDSTTSALDDREVDRLIGNELRAQRSRRRMTIVALAEASGVSRSTIERIERGARSMRVPQLFAFATALQIDPVTFVDRALEADHVSHRPEVTGNRSNP